MNKAQFDSLPEKDRMNRTLEGTAYWAFVSKPKVSEKYKTTTYTLNLGLDAENQRLAEMYGLKVMPADKNTPMPYVVINRKVRAGRTAEEVRPSVVDSMQNEVPRDVLIGNESKVRVKFGTYWFENNGGGVGTTLFKVQILKLIEFVSGKDRSLVMDESGYRAGSPDGDFELDFLGEEEVA